MPKYFGADLPPISQLEKRAALALIGSSPVIDNLGPLLETVIPVAGLHIQDAERLPEVIKKYYRFCKYSNTIFIQDLEMFCNSSKKGTVLFSLGSSIHSKNLPIEKQELFIKIFSEFEDYNFLWKFESNEIAKNLPKNVLIRPWLPQSDILAHPKLRVFITHGGM